MSKKQERVPHPSQDKSHHRVLKSQNPNTGQTEDRDVYLTAAEAQEFDLHQAAADAQKMVHHCTESLAALDAHKANIDEYGIEYRSEERIEIEKDLRKFQIEAGHRLLAAAAGIAALHDPDKEVSQIIVPTVNLAT